MTDADHTANLTAACTAARLAFGAGSVSIAVITPGGGDLSVDHLHYVAAEGRGSEGILGVRLPAGKGIASYVAATGQALVVDHVADDARFARDVAERTGYVPTTLLAVPITDRNGQVLGVLSVLDRGNSAGDALALGSAFAATVAPLVASSTADRDAAPAELPPQLAALEPEQRATVLDLLDGIIGAVQPRRRGRRD
jgi:GAF domain-containing protein